jgi:hypothetical protein
MAEPAKINKEISIDDLDLTITADNGYEFEYISESPDIPRGIFFKIIGSNSDTVQRFIHQAMNKMWQREAFYSKKGKEDPNKAEFLSENNAEMSAIRLIGWRGISTEFNFKNATKLCLKNQELRDLIITKSDELANFTKSK